MTSRRNINLNKELANDWAGHVRRWKRQWVPVDDKPPPGKKACMLLKWVQTDDCAHPGPSRHPHIVPVKDLSLVPGARVGPAPDATEEAGALVADPTAAPPLLDPSMQQEAAPAAPSAAATAADAPLQPSALTAAAAPAPAALDGQPTAAAPAAATAGDLAAAAAAAGLGPPTLDSAAAAAGYAGLPQPTLLAGTAGGLSLGVGGLGQAVSSQQLMMAGLGGAASMPAASDYTAGTDSEALGRLPHGGAAVSDYTGGTDSMDVDGGLGGTMSQGTASMRRAAGDTDMDEEDELDDGLGDDDEEDQDEEEEDDDDAQQQQEHDGLEDDGLERGVVAVGGDDDDEDDDEDEEEVEDDMPG